jgi:hypothetical protein
MKANKQNSLKTREKVLQALSTSSLYNLTPDEILMALKEDGVESLEGLVTRLTETIKDSADQSSQFPSRINLQLLSRQTPKELVSTIVHRVPKVSFVLDGTEYDPKDIRRFDGREIHFVIGSQSAPRNAMLAFEDRNILANWLQIIYLSKFAGLNVASTSPSQSTDIGILVHGPEHPQTPGGGAWGPSPRPLPPPPAEQGPLPTYSPHATVEVRMFDQVNFKGQMLMLGPGLSLPVLTWVPRGQFLQWKADWNDAIRSIYSTSSVCAYFEDVSFSGAIRIVVPNLNVYDLEWLGFDKSISSVMNFG